MRTTVDLPADLLREAKVRAALDGTTLKELITRFVEQGLRWGTGKPTTATRRARSPLPVITGAESLQLPALTNAELYQLLDEEDVTRERAG